MGKNGRRLFALKDVLRRRWSPAEGWLTVILHASLIVATAWTMERAVSAPTRHSLIVAALGGFVAGVVLGKLRAPDPTAHLLAVSGGIVVAFAIGVAGLDPLVGGWRDRVRFQWELLLEWYRLLLSSRPLDDPGLFAAVIALTLWLVAYTSAWLLFRRGWLTMALIVPGIIVVVNLGYEPAGPRPLIGIVVVACLLAARHHVYRREREWASAGMKRPRRLPWHFLGAGANIALLVAILSWSLPLTARELVTTAAWRRLEEPLGLAAERWQDMVGDVVGGRRPAPGSYASFDDAFRLGGQLNLSEDEVAVLRLGETTGGEPPPSYLAARRYNAYDGRGWSSDAVTTFAPAGDTDARYSPEMSFAAGLGVHLSPGVLQDRSAVSGDVTVLRPKGDLLLTTDTFQTADRKFDVELSWQRLDHQVYDLRGDSLSAVLARLPVDLRGLASRLVQLDFTGAGRATDPPMPQDRAARLDLEAERSGLNRRFLETTWSVGEEGRVDKLVVSGQLPVYDDVEAISSERAIAEGSVYGISGLRSIATPEDLRDAGTTYPAWVADRYLGLPESITPRTRRLAQQLGDGQATPFDVARVIESHVRSAIRYEENIGVPPSDQDVVDYVLFETREGYCEYYASAMAVLLRLNGVPARVVGGYFAVPFNNDVDGFLYRERNAHLWVEAYFPGYGWIPFEPTASRARMTYGTAADTLVAAPPPTPELSEPAVAAATPPPLVGSVDPLNQTDGGDEWPVNGWAIIGIGALLAFGVVVGAAVWSWGLRGLSPAGGFYARTLRLGRWLGVRASPTTTPSEYADRLGNAVPVARTAARVVSDFYSEETYGGRPAVSTVPSDVARAWHDVRRAVARSAIRRPRRRGQR